MTQLSFQWPRLWLRSIHGLCKYSSFPDKSNLQGNRRWSSQVWAASKRRFLSFPAANMTAAVCRRPWSPTACSSKASKSLSAGIVFFINTPWTREIEVCASPTRVDVGLDDDKMLVGDSMSRMERNEENLLPLSLAALIYLCSRLEAGTLLRRYRQTRKSESKSHDRYWTTSWWPACFNVGVSGWDYPPPFWTLSETYIVSIWFHFSLFSVCIITQRNDRTKYHQAGVW